MGSCTEMDFTITGDSVQLMCIESRLKEGLNFERCADLEVDDGVDKTVTILSQLVTWSNQTSILLARMSMDGFDICVVLCCGLRGADRHIKKVDCTNESGVREIRERQDTWSSFTPTSRFVRQKRVR